MLSLIRWIIARYKPKKELTPEQKVTALLHALRQASPDELGGVLAVAMQAKKTLDTTRLIETPFPADILDGHTPLDEAGRARLEKYVRDMERFRRICLSEGTILTASVANGIETWIVTFLTLTLPAMAEGRELWAFLLRGEPNVEAAYRFMVRRDLTDVERDYLTYRPRILLVE
ncbi:MAG: hypothetical protein EPO08_13485 [Rhodospirillaceae bacterium]|nr:MAG: hypothetical protein EPO08_13485 [Rhodospirillaceae bacterium]